MSADLTDAANAAQKQRGRPFEPGQSGNPAGKAKGTRHRTTLAIEALLEGEAETLTRKAIDLALAGDMTALRLCMDRLVPVRRDRPVMFDLPKIGGAGEVKAATEAVLVAVSSGELTPGEASEIGKLIDAHLKAIEVSDFEDRLNKLEANRNGQS